MKRITFLLLSIFSLFISACTIDNEDTVSSKKPSKEEIHHRFEVTTNIISNLLEENDYQQKISEHLDSISKIPYVEDAYMCDSIIFVKIKDGCKLVIPYDYRNILAEDEPNSEEVSTRIYNDHTVTSNKSILLIAVEEINPISENLFKLIDVYDKNGFKTEVIVGDKANRDFLKNKMFDYENIILYTHGVVDPKTKKHKLLTGERFDFNSANIDLTIEDEVLWKCEGENYWNYAIDEDFISNQIKEAKSNTIFFNAACLSMAINENLARAFLDKNVGTYLGYSIETALSHIAATNFFYDLLQGSSVIEAANNLKNSDIKAFKKIDDLLVPVYLKEEAEKLHIKGNVNACIIHSDFECSPAHSISESGAIIDLTITNPTKDLIAGICYSTESEKLNLTDAYIIKDTITNCKDSEITINFELKDIEPSTKYYFKPFIIINKQTTLFGESDFFTTSDDLRIVDLGLSVKWAAWNIGANSPEEYGGFYAWGETKEKSSYKEENYAFYDSEKDKFISVGSDISRTKYDVAHVQWGGNWRMPTKEEVEELQNNCKWEWVSLNGVKCAKVTGPSGASIHIPLAGVKGSNHTYKGKYGYYWTSTEETYSSTRGIESAKNLLITAGYKDEIKGKWYGQCVRAVIE